MENANRLSILNPIIMNNVVKKEIDSTQLLLVNFNALIIDTQIIANKMSSFQ